jgi:hypothetical protein
MRSALVTINVFIIPFAASAQTIEQPAPKVGDECHYDVLDNQNAREKLPRGMLSFRQLTLITLPSLGHKKFSSAATREI